MKKCPKCGSRIREGSAFCVNCGTKIAKGRYLQKSRHKKHHRFLLIISILLMFTVIGVFAARIVLGSSHSTEDLPGSVTLNQERVDASKKLTESYKENISYDVTNIEWSGDVGSATVIVKTPDVEMVISTSIQKAIEECGTEDYDLVLNRAREIMQDILMSNECPILESTVSVAAEKCDNGYELISDEMFENALSGNLEKLYIEALLEVMNGEEIN